MAKYINAERLKDSMFAYYDCLNESAKGRPYKGDTLMDYEVVDMIEDCIENAPTADVEEVKHGYWIKNKPNPKIMKMFHDKGIGKGMSEESIFYTCSCCGTWGSLTQKHCSECGAKMDGGNAE